MTGPSFQFVGFAILIAMALSVARTVAWRERIMLVASLIFLAASSTDPIAFSPLAGFLLIGFLSLRFIDARNPAVFSVILAYVLVLFFWIKKYTFVPASLWLTFPYVTVGLSYMLFRLLHLIIEAREQPAFGRISIREYLAYLIGFNTLIAGPIQMFDDYRDAQREATERKVSALDIGAGLERVAIGLFKTNILAALLVAARQRALGALHDHSATLAHRSLGGGLVFALYGFFLYCNFSGYIDIVIGVSRFFLQRLPENFDRPFSATSFIDFWNRWHITLSRWLRTYVYNPLLFASMRRFPDRRVEPWLGTFAFFVTFFLVGMWHGQTSGFLFFGFLQGLGVAGNKAYQTAMIKRFKRKGYEAIASRPIYEAVARGLTMTWFTFTLTWFWGTWSEAANVWSALSIVQWILVWLGIFAAFTLLLALWEAARSVFADAAWTKPSVVTSRRLRTVYCTALITGVVIAAIVASQPAPQIVYKNF